MNRSESDSVFEIIKRFGKTIDDKNTRIKRLEDALQSAIWGWKRCYIAYDNEVTKISGSESLRSLQKELDYQRAQKALEGKD